MSDLQGRRVAFLVTNGYEPSELYSPWDAVTDHGREAVLVSPEPGEVSGGDHSQKVDLDLAEATAADFDALVLPGGPKNAHQIRLSTDPAQSTRAHFAAG